jgi:Phage capsid family
VVAAVRAATPAPRFRCPGWIIGPESLDRLTQLRTADCLTQSDDPRARSLDSFPLLRLDGADGGSFLGYPFVVSAAAENAIYFAADWREAWIGFDGPVVRVDASSDAAFQADQTLIRATMSYDFALRRQQGFGWAQLPEPQ